MTAAGEKFLGVRGGGNPPLIRKIYTPPLQERKLHPPLGFLTLSTCGCVRDYLCDLYVRACMDILFSLQGPTKRCPPTSGHELKHLPSPNQSINKELNPTARTHKGKKHYNQQCELQMLKKTRWSAHCRRRVLVRPGY